MNVATTIVGMRPRDVLLSTMIAAIWGFNFVVIKVGLDNFPPLLFAALRFVAAALPAIFFLKRPKVALRWFVFIGLALGVGQFGLLFIGMHLGMPAGLSSVVLQTATLFTVLFARVLLNERLSPLQALGMIVAFGGVTLIGVDFGQGSPITAFVLCVVGASMWGLANVAIRRMNQTAEEPVDALAFMVWMSLVPPVPLLGLSMIFEGPGEDLRALQDLSLAGAGAVAYIAYLSTLVGFGLWGWLMRRYEAGTVAMYALLVPPFGIASAVLVLNERVSGLRLFAAALIISGVAIGSLRRRKPPEPEIEPLKEPALAR